MNMRRQVSLGRRHGALDGDIELHHRDALDADIPNAPGPRGIRIVRQHPAHRAADRAGTALARWGITTGRSVTRASRRCCGGARPDGGAVASRGRVGHRPITAIRRIQRAGHGKHWTEPRMRARWCAVPTPCSTRSRDRRLGAHARAHRARRRRRLQPLADLRLPRTPSYLGLVHFEDGVAGLSAGSRRRLATWPSSASLRIRGAPNAAGEAVAPCRSTTMSTCPSGTERPRWGKNASPTIVRPVACRALTPKPEESVAFARDMLGLFVVAEQRDSVYRRCWGDTTPTA